MYIYILQKVLYHNTVVCCIIAGGAELVTHVQSDSQARSMNEKVVKSSILSIHAHHLGDSTKYMFTVL